MNTYWCRYFVHNEIPDEHMVEKWPKGMKGWESGFNDSGRIMCARVDAESSEQADAIVRSCYGKSGKTIAIDFINENPLGWRPTGGRFPE